MAYLDENGLEHFWGKIKDRVSSAVAPKADDADVLHKTGTETVSGEKVFSGIQTTAAGNETALMVIKDATLVKGETPATNHYLSLGFIDSTGDSYAQDVSSRLGVVEYKSPSEADPRSCMQLVDFGFDDDNSALLQVGHDKDSIQYATAPATSDDRTNSTDIITRGYMEASEWNWQKTKKASMVTFKPVPESDLEPVVDFMFTETPPAEGDKGPDNPSTIAGVSQAKITRCGKNLCPIDKFYIGSSTGLTVSANTTDGYISISGTASTSVSIYLRNVSGKNSVFASNIILRGKTYTFSLSGDAPSGVALNLFVKATEASAWTARVNVTSGHSRTYTIPATTYDAILRIDIASETTLDCKCYAQVEEGATSTPFEPYEETDYTIQLGDTYYGGSLDVATGVMTVTYSGMVLDGTENWMAGATGSYNNYTLAISPNAKSVPRLENCTHFLAEGNLSTDTEHFYATGGGVHFFSSKPDLASWKSWLASQSQAGTPVVFTYFIDPFTVQLTPIQIRSLPAIDKYEPRINTIYTDQEAVQVGYQRYVDEDNLVHKTGNETIAGEKIFSNRLILHGTLNISGNDVYIITGSAQNRYYLCRFTNLANKTSYDSSSICSAVLGLQVNNSDIPVALYNQINTNGNVYNIFRHNHVSGSDTAQFVFASWVGRYEGAVYCTVDNKYKLGDSNFRWTAVYAATGSINTSDERLKTEIAPLPDNVLDAWEGVEWKQFKFTDSVDEKGLDAARLHAGAVAQSIDAAFSAAGLDAGRYGFFCHDSWEAKEAEYDENGSLLNSPREAGDRYSLRYEEALCMEAAYMRRENARLKKRVADLEERLAALELKIS